tara:strand:- start:2055 stop:3377 length:1323 start_codon:yes stop_codon:yes gene_type:complete
MKKLYSWIDSRKNFIFQLFLESIIFVITRFSYEKNEVSNLSFIILYLAWFFFSYVIGRYYINTKKLSSIVFQIIFKILVLNILIFISINLYSLLIIKTNLTQINIYFSLLNYVNFPIILLNLLNSIYTNLINFKIDKLLFVGSKEKYDIFLEIINQYSLEKNLLIKNFRFDYYDPNKKISLKKFNQVILEDPNFIKPNDKNLKSILEETQTISILEWSKTILNRYPIELLNEKNSNELDFLNNKKLIEIRLKRLSEVLLSLILLFAAFPILLFCAICIYIEDRGPIFYTQDRTGKDGVIFKLTKLRTMITNAERNGPQWSRVNDSRVTNTGLILRKLRIDELPQLVSVIIGDMSLIGPRPERPSINSDLAKSIPFYNLRHKVKPGLSGWAQVNYPYGSSISDSKIKLSYDLYYINHFSNFLDILIFFKTIRLVFNLKGSL